VRVDPSQFVIRSGTAVFSVWLIMNWLGVVRDRWFGPTRQTDPVWVRRFGHTHAAFLWGLDLSTGFTTQSTYAGYWLLPLVVLLTADPVVGATSYVLFAIARAAPIVGSPVLPKGSRRPVGQSRLWRSPPDTRASTHRGGQGNGRPLLSAALHRPPCGVRMVTSSRSLEELNRPQVLPEREQNEGRGGGSIAKLVARCPGIVRANFAITR